MSVLEARDLVKTFGRRTVVKGVGLSIGTGEIVGLLGRNGAGKTTTFLMIAGLLRPDGGRLSLDGEDISQWTTVERAEKGITYLPQEGSIFLKESVLGNLLMLLELQGLSRRERTAAATALLEELGLQDLASQEAYSLSGGERRRLEICRALVLKPRFLLLDEPFTGIDPLTILELQKIFLRLKSRDIGIVVSDHNVHDTFKIVDRACIIDEGEILMEGSPDRLAADTRVREKFLGSSFRFGADVEISFGERGEDPGVMRPVRSARAELLLHDAADAPLPAPDTAGDESGRDTNRERTSAEEAGVAASGRIRRRPGFLLPGFVDFLLVSFFWFLSILLASRILETPFERLLTEALTALLGYAATLSAWYVLLSRLVFGRTLGQRIFRRSKPD